MRSLHDNMASTLWSLETGTPNQVERSLLLRYSFLPLFSLLFFSFSSLCMVFILIKQGARRIMKYHGNSMTRALLELFPEIGLQKSDLWKSMYLSPLFSFTFSFSSSSLLPPASSLLPPPSSLLPPPPCSYINLLCQIVQCGKRQRTDEGSLKNLQSSTSSIRSPHKSGIHNQ